MQCYEHVSSGMLCFNVLREIIAHHDNSRLSEKIVSCK